LESKCEIDLRLGCNTENETHDRFDVCLKKLSKKFKNLERGRGLGGVGGIQDRLNATVRSGDKRSPLRSHSSQRRASDACEEALSPEVALSFDKPFEKTRYDRSKQRESRGRGRMGKTPTE
jgi:hypothetical protein